VRVREYVREGVVEKERGRGRKREKEGERGRKRECPHAYTERGKWR